MSVSFCFLVSLLGSRLSLFGGEPCGIIRILGSSMHRDNWT